MKLLEYWLSPDGSGDPIGCLATTFTFEGDFFSTECLARFLRLSGAYGEGDHVSDVALMLEEEERLSETSVVVLADRNCRPEARNLRWDLVPVAVPGALLHAKTTLLIWQNLMRVVIGSANLTPAGYRRQLECAVAFDIDDQASIPGPFVLGVLDELQNIVEMHVYGDSSEPGPKSRALHLLDIGRQRAALLPRRPRGNVRIALAPGRSGRSPLAGRADVWRGPQPYRVVALSPFWDEGDALRGAQAVMAELSGRRRGTTPSQATFVVSVEALPDRRVVRAPQGLSQLGNHSVAVEVRAVAEQDRRLHAKATLYEGTECVALMVGSSNLTASGLGLTGRSHREINVWFAASPDSREADQLRAMISIGDLVEPDADWEPGDNEDELRLEALPDGFVDAILTIDGPARVLRLTLDPSRLPSRWSIAMPSGSTVLNSEEFHAAQSPRVHTTVISDTLPSALDVSWFVSAGQVTGTWPVNVGDLGLLPPPDELRNLPTSVLLNILASTRPLRAALESELRRHESSQARDDLDPLRRFDSSGQLLHRIRRASAALWGLEQRLQKPTTNFDALKWRFTGVIGPAPIAAGLVADVERGQLREAEAYFLLAELALTVSRVNWQAVALGIEPREVGRLVKDGLEGIHRQAQTLERNARGEIEGLVSYATEAFREAGIR